MNDGVALPQLLRKARKAAFNHAYDEALDLYASIIRFPEMADNLDIKTRYAYCAEQAGQIDMAVRVYEEIVDIYYQQGETGAAEALEQAIDQLKRAPVEEEEQETPQEPEVNGEGGGEEAAPVEELNDEQLMQTLCGMGEQRHLYPSEPLCHAGDMPDALWLLLRGKLDVEMPDYEERDILFSPEGAITLAGELGFFTLQRRTASLIAHSEVDYCNVEAETIRLRQRNDPVFDRAMERLLRERWVEPVLSQHSVFERINDIDRKRLAGTFERITLEPGVTVIDAGEEHDGAYLLQSGCMFFMHHIDDGTQEMDEHDDGSQMIGIHPGDMIHLGGLLRGYKSSYRIVTATPVQLLYLSRERFEPFTMRRPWIIQAILRYSRRPAHLQVMHPEDDYLWQANRNITLRRVI